VKKKGKEAFQKCGKRDKLTSPRQHAGGEKKPFLTQKGKALFGEKRKKGHKVGRRKSGHLKNKGGRSLAERKVVKERGMKGRYSGCSPGGRKISYRKKGESWERKREYS